MNTDSELNIQTDRKSETDVMRQPAPMASAKPRYFSGRLKQLKHWMKAGLIAHEKRTSSLRVYRQNRTD